MWKSIADNISCLRTIGVINLSAIEVYFAEREFFQKFSLWFAVVTDKTGTFERLFD